MEAGQTWPGQSHSEVCLCKIHGGQKDLPLIYIIPLLAFINGKSIRMSVMFVFLASDSSSEFSAKRDELRSLFEGGVRSLRYLIF